MTCSSSEGGPGATEPTVKTSIGHTRGDAVVLSRDERIAVACNRSASVVTIFLLDPTATPDKVILQKKEIDLGPDWEPWVAVIGADDDTAYVVSRHKQVVLRILRLHSDPTRDDPLHDAAVGSEPTAIVITPSGERLFVANWADGTIGVITTYDFKTHTPIDLNEPLARTGRLGSVASRLALAHPRALAITDHGHGDDDEETLYATEFFSQPMLESPRVPPPNLDAGTPGQVFAEGGAGGAGLGPPEASVIAPACMMEIANPAASCLSKCLCRTCPVPYDDCLKEGTDTNCKAFVQCAHENHCGDPKSCGVCMNLLSRVSLSIARPPCFTSCSAECPIIEHPDGSIADAGTATDAMTSDATVDATSLDATVSDAMTPDTGGTATDAAAAPATPPPGDVTSFDRNREGLVYPFPIREGVPGDPIPIRPVADTGFYDAPNAALDPAQRRPTSCFPNQLYAAVIDNDRLYVTSMCASPAGPLGPAKKMDNSTDTSNFKTIVYPVVFAIDTTKNVEAPEQRLVLTQKLEGLYAADNAAERRFPLVPNAIVASSSTSGKLKLYITALSADAVFEAEPASGASSPGGPGTIGEPGARFVDLAANGVQAGRLPVGIAVSQRTEAPFALVVNDATQNVSVIDLAKSSVVAFKDTADEVRRAKEYLDSPANNGHRLFATGLDTWSFKGEAWLSCESCHPDGLSDGVTWFFARGPRRTISAAGTYDSGPSPRRRMMLWGGNIDEVHDIEAIVRSVAGGSGVMLWTYPFGPPSNDLRILYDGTLPIPKGEKVDPKPTTTLLNNLNGSLASLVQNKLCAADAPVCDTTAVTGWNDVDAFIRTVRAPRAPTMDADQASLAAQGKALFEQGNCAACHGGPGFTLSKVFYTPGVENNGALPYAAPPSMSVPPALLGQLRTVTYDVPMPMTSLNPPGKSGSAPLRRWSPGSTDSVTYAYQAATAAADQINCVLRDVGTFPAQPPASTNFLGVTPPGAPQVLELRQDMKTLALGATGFNIPSLVGIAAGAPYFHAGNARTLEEALDIVFEKHHQALAPGFLGGSDQRRSAIPALVAYLLSIDDSTQTIDPPAQALGFNPDLCARTATAIR